MHKKLIALLFALCFQLGTTAVLSQGVQSTLTNVDVVEMVRAGINESTIILAIKKSETDFDTSTEALIELKKSGVSSKILDAMLLSRSVPQTLTEGKPDISTNEVFLIEGENRILLTRSASKFHYGMGYFQRKGAFVSLDNKKAQRRVIDTTPEFEVSLPSNAEASSNLVVVRLTPKSRKREVKILNWPDGRVANGRRKRKVEYPKDEIFPTAFEEIRHFETGSGTKYIQYRVRVVSPLPPGEYAFLPLRNNFKYYDFGIDETPK